MLENESISVEFSLSKTLEKLKSRGVTFDIDNVEIDTLKTAVMLYNDIYGFKYKNPKTTEDVTTYWAMVDWMKDIPQIENPVKAAIDIFHDERVLIHSKPVSGFQALLKYLTANGISPLTRITSRPGMARDHTYLWYRNRYGEFDINLIRIQDEGDQINSNFKSQEIGKKGAPYHFEDSFEHAEQIIEETEATVVLVPQPWNERYVPETNRIIVSNSDFHKPRLLRAFYALAKSIETS